jgi:hypothetical protein
LVALYVQQACERHEIGGQMERWVVTGTEFIDDVSITYCAPNRYPRAIPTEEDDREA